jgi:hypothetical protein
MLPGAHAFATLGGRWRYLAKSGGRRCYLRQALLLPAAPCLCYLSWAAALPCCVRRAMLLLVAGAIATKEGRFCYQGMTVALPWSQRR